MGVEHGVPNLTKKVTILGHNCHINLTKVILKQANKQKKQVKPNLEKLKAMKCSHANHILQATKSH